ncbi:hypothetical protein NPIL_235641 [Nephila pilipes]|uniref:Uncharacterized protein n=1 Tax=Nephila pilipes TaxID=299642 RepID=A0A8X6J005_NEPPI|nr:hypothetical protein NPIL_235641 [Nephila pilipes]
MKRKWIFMGNNLEKMERPSSLAQTEEEIAGSKRVILGILLEMMIALSFNPERGENGGGNIVALISVHRKGFMSMVISFYHENRKRNECLELAIKR